MSAVEKIINHLTALYPHCKHYERRNDDTIATLFRGYLQVFERRWPRIDTRDDVAGWIGNVCENWMDTIADRKHEFPSAAQLRDLAAGYEPRSADDKGPKAWRPISKAEYQGLSIRDKARHCRIMAHELAMKAGGMNTKGQLLRPDDFAHYHPMRERYEAEAKRLEGLLQGYDKQSTASEASSRNDHELEDILA